MSGSELGPVVFERKPKTDNYYFLLTFGIVVIGMGGLVGVGGYIVLEEKSSFSIGGPIAGFGVLLLLATRLTRYVFRCHELGISRTKGKTERTLRFDEIESVKYEGVALYTVGVFHSHTNVKMTFSPKGDSKRKAIQYKETKFDKDGGDVGKLMDQVVVMISERMEDELEREGQVEWMGGVVLHQNGIELQRANPGLYSFDELDRYRVKNAMFELWKRGEKGSITWYPVDASNFFPGYLLFEKLWQERGN